MKLTGTTELGQTWRKVAVIGQNCEVEQNSWVLDEFMFFRPVWINTPDTDINWLEIMTCL